MERVLALLGSPRKSGNSETLAGAVLDGMREEGGEPEVVRLCDLKINPCLSCGGCAKTGACVLEDDMDLLYHKLITYPRIIMAAPIFFYGIPAQAKAFVDRCQALWSRKQILKQQGKWKVDGSRKGFLVSVAATQGERVFEGAILTMQYAFDAMGLAYSGEVLVRGVDHRGEMQKARKEMVEAREAGRRFMA